MKQGVNIVYLRFLVPVVYLLFQKIARLAGNLLPGLEPTSFPGARSGEFFQDTLQVPPCKLLASFDLQGWRKCRRIAGSNPCPAGDGPERTHPSLSLTLGPEP
jgi:hypothetical protein